MGGVFKDLTKSQVQAPGQPDQLVNPGMPTAQAIAQDSIASAQPSISTIDGTLGPSDSTVPVPMQNAGLPASGGADDLTIGMTPHSMVVPTVTRPSFADANLNNPGALTTKGRALSMVLDAMTGAAAGQAAVSEGTPRTGYPGAGVAALAGLTAPLQLRGTARAQQREAQMADLDQQYRRQQIAEAQQRGAYYEAGADRRDVFNIGGNLVDTNGKVLYHAPSATPRQQSLQELYAGAIQGGDTAGAEKYKTAIQDLQKPTAYTKAHALADLDSDDPEDQARGQSFLDNLQKFNARNHAGMRGGSAPSRSTANASVATHAFSSSRWAAANPGGDVAQARKQAKASGFTVVD